MRVEIVRLQAVDHCGAFADPSVGEFHEGRGARRVLVGGEYGVTALRGITGDLFDVAPHAEQQRVERMAARRQQRTAPELLLRVPAILPVPGTDAMVVVDFAVVNPAEQARVDHRPGREKLRRISAFEADAGGDPACRRGLLHVDDVGPFDRQRLLDDDVLPMPRGEHELLGVLVRVARDVDDVDVVAFHHRLQVVVHSQLASMACAQLARRQRPRRPDVGDLRLTGCIDRRDMRRRRPAVPEDCDVIRFRHRSCDASREPRTAGESKSEPTALMWAPLNSTRARSDTERPRAAPARTGADPAGRPHTCAPSPTRARRRRAATR